MKKKKQVMKRLIASLLCVLLFMGTIHPPVNVLAVGGTFTVPNVIKPLPGGFENSSFETPIVGSEAANASKWGADNSFPQAAWVPINQVPGWNSTLARIEIQHATPGGQSDPVLTNRAHHAAAGQQYAELNVSAAERLFQTASTTPNATYFWQFAHAKRQNSGAGPNILALYIAGNFIDNFSTTSIINGTSNAWDYNRGVYQATSSLTEFGFQAVTGQGLGNFLDDVLFLSAPKLLLEKTMVAAVAPARVGSTVVITVDVTNWGEVDAGGVLFEDTLDAGLTFVDGSAKVNGISVANQGTGQQVTLDLGMIQGSAVLGNNQDSSASNYGKGETKTVTFETVINSVVVNPIENQASATYDAVGFEDLSNGPWIDYSYVAGKTLDENDSDTYVNRLILKPDVSIIKEVDEATARVGETLTWSITVTNAGAVEALGVKVKDELPEGISYADISAVTPSTAQIAAAGSDGFIWTIPVLAANDGTATLTFSAKVPAGTEGTDLLNTVTVTEIDEKEPETPITDDAKTTIIAPDLAIVKEVDKATAKVGETLTWTVTVTNSGEAGATGVKVSDELPTGIAYADITAITPSTAQIVADGNNKFIWTIPTIAATNGTAAVTFSAKVPEGTSEDTELLNIVKVTEFDGKEPETPITDDAKTTVIAPKLAIVKEVDKATAKVGEMLTWTIAVTNSGEAEATGVKVYDELPAGIAYADISAITPATAQIVADGNGFVWTIPTLAANTGAESVTFSAKVPVATPEGTNLLNTVTVTEIDEREPETPITDDAKTKVIAPNLAIVKEVDKATEKAGATLIWTITVTNSGEAEAAGVKVRDELPTGITYADISAVTPSDAQIAADGSNGFIWTIPAVAANNGTATVQFSAKVPVGAAAGDELLNTATVTEFDEKEPETPITDDAKTIVIDSDLTIVKDVDKAAAKVGEILTWTVTVTNSGEVEATEVKVYDELPAGIAYADVSAIMPADAQIVADGNNGFIWTIPTIAANNGAATVTFSAKVPAGISEGADLTNTVTVTEINKKRPKTPIMDDARTEVIVPKLAIVKDVDKATVKAGETLTWTITVTNSGKAEATGVKVGDALPEGIAYADISAITPATAVIAADGNNGFIWTIPTIAADNGTAAVTFSAKVPIEAKEGTNLLNTATVIEIDEREPETPITDDAETKIVVPKLAIVKDVDKATAKAGAMITWTITVTNSGEAEATGVKVRDELPAGISYADISAVMPSSAEIAADGNNGFIWTIPAIAADNGTAAVTFSAKVPVDMTKGTELINTATVTEIDEKEPETPITDDAKTTVIDSSLTIVKDVDKATAKAGEMITWTITVTNDGAAEVTDIKVNDTLPKGIRYADVQTVTPSVGTVTAGGKGFIWTIPTIAANNGTATVTFSAKVPVDVKKGAELINVAVITEIDGKEPEVPITDDAKTTVTASNLTVVKAVNKATAKEGDLLTYTLIVTNKGNEVAKDVKITDPIPLYTEYISSSHNGKLEVKKDVEYVTWSIDSLKPNQSITLTMTVKVNNCVPKNYVIQNTAYCESDGESKKDSNTVNTTLQRDSRLPKTGDDTNMRLFTILACTSVLIIILGLRKQRKEQQ